MPHRRGRIADLRSGRAQKISGHHGARSAAKSAVARAAAPSTQLLDAAATHELVPRHAAEIGRAELADVAAEVRLAVAALDAVGADAPAALVPRALLVRDLDHHRLEVGVRAGAERLPDVHEPHPQPVADTRAEVARLGEEERELVVDGEQPRTHELHPVDVEQVAPDRRRRARGRAERLDHVHVAVGEAVLPVRVDPVDRVAVGAGRPARRRGARARRRPRAGRASRGAPASPTRSACGRTCPASAQPTRSYTSGKRRERLVEADDPDTAGRLDAGARSRRGRARGRPTSSSDAIP